MPISKQKVFISTAIDYVNAAPHLGHALEKIQADVVARHRRILGEEVFYLSGTDENSLKNVQAARKEKISTKELVDRNAKKFYGLKNALNLSFDDFIRTTEERHIKGARKLWKKCEGDIYKKKYKGLYCVGCEQFYKENELEDGLCPEHKKKPELVEEENYFFSLSKYQDRLKKIIETDQIKIIPKTRKNETISFINQGLEDICVSRSSSRASGWGIDVPGDSTQKIWVWLDALSNYINALGYGGNEKKFQELWQENENKIHIGRLFYYRPDLLCLKPFLSTVIFPLAGRKCQRALGMLLILSSLPKNTEPGRPVIFYCGKFRRARMVILLTKNLRSAIMLTWPRGWGI